METSVIELAQQRAILQRLLDAVPVELELEHTQLRGGLEAAGVSRLSARYRDRTGRSRVFACVIKRVAGAAARELRVYRHLVASHVAGMAPRLLASHEPATDNAVLYLELLRPTKSWPWGALGTARAVLEHAARLHTVELDPGALEALSDWNYESELRRNAAVTLERLEEVVRRPEFSGFMASVPPARRLLRSLPDIRRILLAFNTLRRGPIHGDLHPGNAVVRRRNSRDEPVLIDWGRARIGSPLEDISSWLHSLAEWEPEARRRHDTLFVSYLAARGMEARLCTDLRAAYWLAGASNAFAGGLLHHLSRMLDQRATSRRRLRAAYSARQWMRVLRRADAVWS
ncbi:MAG TPA: aminoglycoside phosphotransferase family protein [Gemmatimonadales bacterium]|nr:aminoglycoside phosphotransferase family protein [Gemmatimonadales bacterium]